MTDETSIAAPSLFDNPFGWLMNKFAELGQQRREEVEEWAEHRAGQKMETYLAQNPDFATEAKLNADKGLEHGTISPAVYEMLQRYETTTDHAPAPQASISVEPAEMVKEQSRVLTR